MTERVPLNCLAGGGVCAAVTAHYRKDGTNNILPRTTSLLKAPAILYAYE